MRIVSLINKNNKELFCRFAIRQVIDEAQLRTMISKDYPDFHIEIDNFSLLKTLDGVKNLIDKWGV